MCCYKLSDQYYDVAIHRHRHLPDHWHNTDSTDRTLTEHCPTIGTPQNTTEHHRTPHNNREQHIYHLIVSVPTDNWLTQVFKWSIPTRTVCQSMHRSIIALLYVPSIKLSAFHHTIIPNLWYYNDCKHYSKSKTLSSDYYWNNISKSEWIFVYFTHNGGTLLSLIGLPRYKLYVWFFWTCQYMSIYFPLTFWC